MRQLLKMVLFAGILLLPLVPAEATLLTGQTIQTTYLFPDTSTIFAGPTNSIVGPGVELSNFALFADIDFDDTSIFIVANRDAQINGVTFDGLKFADINIVIPAFTNVVLDISFAFFGSMGTQNARAQSHVNLPDVESFIVQQL